VIPTPKKAGVPTSSAIPTSVPRTPCPGGSIRPPWQRSLPEKSALVTSRAVPSSAPGYFRWDASLYKNTRISERFSLQFRAEAFNVLNHTNWNNPASTSLTSGVYNKITTARDPRQMQLAQKLIF
jgi:hypothetical protein